MLAEPEPEEHAVPSAEKIERQTSASRGACPDSDARNRIVTPVGAPKTGSIRAEFANYTPINCRDRPEFRAGGSRWAR